jgi:hypothetical protein
MIGSGLVLAPHRGVTGGIPWNDPNTSYATQALAGLSADEWLRGIVPWNPYTGVGMPLAGFYDPFRNCNGLGTKVSAMGFGLFRTDQTVVHWREWAERRTASRTCWTRRPSSKLGWKEPPVLRLVRKSAKAAMKVCS